MKRFINADIIPGKLSNAITLNRFAYANGNPVSFVDPFGLWSLKGAWNSFTNWVEEDIFEPVLDYVEEKVFDPVVDWSKEKFKNLENKYLEKESSWSDNYNTTFDNYENNLKNDIKNSCIDDQSTNLKVKKLKLGNYSMDYSGCEVIAVYNAKIMLGDKDVSLADTIEQFVNCGALTMQPILRGGFGGNPFSIGKVLEAEGLKYSTIEGFNDTSDPGVYVVSFWHDSSFDSQIHTVAVNVNDDGKAEVYNYNAAIDNKWDHETYEELLFITGYKVSRK